MNISKALLIAAVNATSVIAYENAYAIPIKVTDLNPHYVASIASCVGRDAKGKAGLGYADCTTTASISNTMSLVGNDPQFTKSFDAWNNANAMNAKWTLADGGKLPGGEFHVSIFDAFAHYSVGGLKINVDWIYGGKDKAAFKWVQGLYSNYTIEPTVVVPPFLSMDVVAGGCDNGNLSRQCPPLYPFQHAKGNFFDGPQGPWPNSFFDAWTFLSKTDFTTRTLTIYEGVNYGFALDAFRLPEPSNLLLFLVGVIGASVARVQRKKMVQTN